MENEMQTCDTGYCGLLTPFVYYYFVTWRYASRRNPYTRNTFRELRVLAERQAERPALPAALRGALASGIQLAERPALPAALRGALASGIQLVCRMAPPTEPQPQRTVCLFSSCKIIASSSSSLEESSSSYSRERRHASLEVHRSYDDVFTPRRPRAEKSEDDAARSFVETRARDPSVA
ncbi:hypothetical protein MSG28_009413 [Choristoneura fumiferana]|uniref:Uncharacterized protein n=1 Tax=Choristoneura fumiferana TaxID=7141 RepID=A0ACC0KXT9_CHOFU|nr:hypothetical protein MSG28_009413 [Choristoneura fumiferana]